MVGQQIIFVAVALVGLGLWLYMALRFDNIEFKLDKQVENLEALGKTFNKLLECGGALQIKPKNE